MTSRAVCWADPVLSSRRKTIIELLGLGLIVVPILVFSHPYFFDSLADNYRAIASGRGLGKTELATLARNSFTGSFLSEEAKAANLAKLDAFVAAN